MRLELQVLKDIDVMLNPDANADREKHNSRRGDDKEGDKQLGAWKDRKMEQNKTKERKTQRRVVCWTTWKQTWF